MSEIEAAYAKLGTARAAYDSKPHEEGRYVHFLECQNRALKLEGEKLRKQVRRLHAIAYARTGRAA